MQEVEGVAASFPFSISSLALRSQETLQEGANERDIRTVPVFF
jgi:hypothetical protein